MRRAESFAGSALYPPGSPLKCAPSFGVISKRSSDAMSVDHSNRSDVTTSDEEEKLRSKKAKKPRVKAASPTPPATSPPMSPQKPKQLRRTTKLIGKPTSSQDGAHRSSRPKANVQRNPSILGPELPSCQTAAPRITPAPVQPYQRLHHSRTQCPTTTPCTPVPGSPTHRSPRRARAPSGRAPVGRKISFGSLAPPQEEENVGFGAGLGLGSAFQLQ